MIMHPVISGVGIPGMVGMEGVPGITGTEDEFATHHLGLPNSSRTTTSSAMLTDSSSRTFIMRVSLGAGQRPSCRSDHLAKCSLQDWSLGSPLAWSG
jgi:hypothetical protein